MAKLLLLAVLISILLTGCALPTPDPAVIEKIEQSTLSAQQTNTPEPTNTPIPTNTLEPTNTPEPSNTPEPTIELTQATDVLADQLKELFVTQLYDYLQSLTYETFKWETVTWIGDEFKMTVKSIEVFTGQMIASAQFPIIEAIAKAFTNELSEATNSNTVVKIIWTMGDSNKQFMTITKYSTLEKIADGRISTAIEWAQEAEIFEQ